MVIDDNPVDRYIAERIFTKYEFAEEIVCIDSAKKALEYLISFKDIPDKLPHLIFLDIMMPEMNGFQFLDEYKNLPETIKQNCIILMLTTSIHSEDHDKANDNPYVNRFLNKPLNVGVLKGLEDLE
ncbi:CheY chemotaxis protein or a CheY-like REC (receiver) domain [Chitinophaga sp. CF118]|nr:CheY chemotaxis protein or a CheY-like REC (receiver) domain [Chitinophaga sp. CF118]